MNELTVFQNSEFGQVRVVDRDGEPWFVAKDICEILALENTSKALLSLDLDEKSDVTGSKVGSNVSKLRLVSESGLYSLIFKSMKPEAKAFKKWVTSEVLPSIRKHGMYATELTTEKMLEDPDFLIKTLQALKDERKKRQCVELELDDAMVKIGESESWQAVKAIPWLKDEFNPREKEMYRMVGLALAKLSRHLGYEIRRTGDTEWLNGVNAYHVEVIEAFRHKLRLDLNMLRPYRLKKGF